MTFWWKIGFPMKCVTVFSSICVSMQKMWRTFSGEVSVRLSELHFICTQDHFGWRVFFLRQKECFNHLDLERKIVWLLLTFYLPCWQNCTFCRQSTLLNLCWNNFKCSGQFRFFRLRSKMCQVFGGKVVNSRHSCILLVERVILEQKTIFVNKIGCFYHFATQIEK